jgi:hypothetical protein
MKDVLSLLQTGGVLGHLVLIAFAVYVLAKAVFELKHNRNQGRKEFLELWKDGDKSDDFWLEMMISHCFGRVLPAPLVRRVIDMPTAPLKLANLASAWSLLTYDSAAGCLVWRKKWLGRWKWALVGVKTIGTIYMLLGVVGGMSLLAWIISSVAFPPGLICLVGAAAILPLLVNLELANDTFKEMAPLLAEIEQSQNKSTLQAQVET